MISWWWAMIAFYVGGMLGVLAAGLCRAASREPELATSERDANHEPALLAALRRNGGTGA